MKRKIIAIDEERCDGCGLCAGGCPEGALRIVDGKARLVGDLLCDGLGACIGTCPRGVIVVEEREAEAYDERKVMLDNIIPKGETTILAHLEHLRDHGEDAYLKTALALLAERGSAPPAAFSAREVPSTASATGSEPRQWPIQMHLINPRASHFRNARLLLAADCAAFAAGDFHERWLKGHALAIACPKLDEGTDRYVDKLVALIDEAKIDTLTVLRMQVPCCGGLVILAQEARAKAQRKVPLKAATINPEGNLLEEVWL